MIPTYYRSWLLCLSVAVSPLPFSNAVRDEELLSEGMYNALNKIRPSKKLPDPRRNNPEDIAIRRAEVDSSSIDSDSNEMSDEDLPPEAMYNALNKIRPSKRLPNPRRNKPDEIAIRRAEVDVSSLDTDLNEMSTIAMQFFLDGPSMKFQKGHTSEKGWFGEDERGNAANFINPNGKVYGSVTFDDMVYSITTLPDKSTVVEEIRTEDFPYEDSHRDDERYLSMNTNSALRGWAPPRERNLELLDSGDVIDIMCVFTKYAMCAEAGYGTTNTCADSPENREPMNQRCKLAVEETNFAYMSSGVETHMRLVYNGMVDFDDLSYYGTENLLNKISNPADGVMDIVHTWREQYHADLVALITENKNFCGLAWPFNNDPSSGFSVIYRKCMTGYYSFAHETGHNMGCTHDRTTKGHTDKGAYSKYNYGYQDPSGRFRTIMAYDCPNGCPKKQRFSNTKFTINYDGKQQPTGSNYDNCARQINAVRKDVANFMTSVPEPEPELTPKTIYLGCYNDVEEDRALDVFLGENYDFDSCAEACLETEAPVFGRQAKGECWCGAGTYHRHGRAQDCGCEAGTLNFWKYCAYMFDNFAGCFKDKVEDRALERFIGAGLSKIDCQRACKKTGYHFMGLQGNNECWCGGSSPTDNSYAVHGSSDQCNCESDNNLVAGTNCIHRIFYPTFKNCWKDSEKRIFPYKAGWRLSNDECLKKCKEKGYHYMGQQGWGECWCGGLNSRDTPFKAYGRESGCACNAEFIGSWKMCVNRIFYRE